MIYKASSDKTDLEALNDYESFVIKFQCHMFSYYSIVAASCKHKHSWLLKCQNLQADLVHRR